MESTYQDLESQSAHDDSHGRRQSQGVLTIDTSNSANRPQGRPATGFRRQKSLVRPERERIDRNHPQYYYRNATQNLDGSHIKVQASTTGNDPNIAPNSATTAGSGGIRRGKSVLGREIEKPGTMRNKAKAAAAPKRKTIADIKNLKNPLKKEKREWPSKWIIYYNAITCCFPAAILKRCGKFTTEKKIAMEGKTHRTRPSDGLLGPEWTRDNGRENGKRMEGPDRFQITTETPTPFFFTFLC